MFFIFPNFQFEIPLILKIGYLSDYNSKFCTNYTSINSIFYLVSKYIIFVIFWLCLILWFYRTPTVGQSQCFDFDFWLFSVKSEISILKISYLVYLYHFHSLLIIFTYLKPLLNLILTKSTLLSVDRPDTYTLLDLYLIFVSSVFINFVWPAFLWFNDA